MLWGQTKVVMSVPKFGDTGIRSMKVEKEFPKIERYVVFKKIINDETIGGAVLVAFSLFFIIPTVEYKIGNVVNNVWQPGAGFYPLFSGILVLIFGIILIVTGIYRAYQTGKTAEKYLETVPEDEPIAPEQQKANIRLLIGTILSVLLMLLLWKFIGFYPAAVIMCALLNFLYKDKILTNILLTVILLGFIFLGFTIGLNITFRI